MTWLRKIGTVTYMQHITINKSAIVFGGILGLLIGFAEYAIDTRFTNPTHPEYTGVIMVGLFALSAMYFVLYASHAKRVTWQLVAASIGIIAFSALVRLPFHEQSFGPFSLVASVPLFLGMIGWALTSLKQDETPVSAGFFVYVQKVLEMAVVDAVALVVIVLLGFLAYNLFQTIGVEIPSSVTAIIIRPIFVMIPFVTLAMTYDFTKSLVAQSPTLGIIKFFSAIGYGLTFVLTPFLLIYLAVLPFGFRTLLATQHTSLLFLILTAVCAIFLYATLLWNAANRAGGLVKKMLTAVSVEAVVMSAIALYAIGVRIARFGITMDRYVVAMACVIVGATFAWFIPAILKENGVEDIKASIEKIAFIGLAALALVVCTTLFF